MLAAAYRKKNFLRFDVPIDVEGLVKEYNAIPSGAWATSYWGDVHCSVGMLLLRGGTSGTERDFYSDDVVDGAELAAMPILSSLIGDEGPFGRAQYAFLFRTEANGVTLVHQDLIEKWQEMYRIHVPLVTNPGAHLIADNKSIHFEAGYAWSFDNHSRHGVVNGELERIHLIFDVPFNPVLSTRIDQATHLTGKEVAAHVAKIESTKKITRSYPGDEEMKVAITELSRRGLSNMKMAEFFNAKKIPTKQFFMKNRRHQTKKWNERMVADLRVALRDRKPGIATPHQPGY